MRRRDLIAGLGGMAVSPVIWPLAARGQRAERLRRIGVLILDSPAGIAPRMPAFLGALEETGYVVGRNVAVEYHSAEHHYDRFPALAAELVRERVDVIFAIAGPSSVVAAKDATTSIPIVFAIGEDPVKLGLVGSFTRPGGNVTGITFMAEEIAPKRLQLLHELVPAASRIAVLVNPSDNSVQSVIADAVAAASTMGLKIEALTAVSDRDIDEAFAGLVEKRIDALSVYPSLFFFERRVQIATLAAHQGVPTIYFDRPFVQAGGLMSYGTDFSDMYRQAGLFIGRTLNGEEPAGMPVAHLTRFDFIINRRAAKLLDIEVPPALLAMATEVIE
jgi:putative ABC transport system substrate-binding protein